MPSSTSSASASRGPTVLSSMRKPRRGRAAVSGADALIVSTLLDARGVPHDFGLGDLGAFEHAGKASVAHDHDAMTEADHFLQLGGDEDDGFALGGKRRNNVIDLLLGAHINAT